jgi:hypothetical protein
MSHFIPLMDITAPSTADAFLQVVFRHHGLPLDIVSDRGSQFTSHFWTALTSALNINRSMSTAHRAQPDGQTERTNQTLEEYLRHYVNYLQDDWANHLALAEFAFNNMQNASTGETPFALNYGYHHGLFQPTLDNAVAVPAALDYMKSRATLQDNLGAMLTKAQQRMKHHADSKRSSGPAFTVGDKVWLSTEFLAVPRPAAKLAAQRIGPFPITKCVGPVTYELALPKTMTIHPVFHVSSLEPFHPNPFPGRVLPPPPPDLIDAHDEFEVDQILDSKIFRGRLQYLVRWRGYSPSDDSWLTAPLSNCAELVTAYHRTYPDRAGPTLPARSGRKQVRFLSPSDPTRGGRMSRSRPEGPSELRQRSA